MLEKQLKQISDSYNNGIEKGKQGINLYENLPTHIMNDPSYLLIMEDESISGGSGCREVREYLSPQKGMKFVDLGCCLNFMFRGYDAWPSQYHGIDISDKTIQLLREHVEKNRLPVGGFHCGSIHDTPYSDSYFDIGACIGVLEYFPGDFAVNAIAEAFRILIPGGRFVLDIPNLGTPAHSIMMKMEAYLGRPELFDLSPEAFEKEVSVCFSIEKKEIVSAGAMLQYYLQSVK